MSHINYIITQEGINNNAGKVQDITDLKRTTIIDEEQAIGSIVYYYNTCDLVS